MYPGRFVDFSLFIDQEGDVYGSGLSVGGVLNDMEVTYPSLLRQNQFKAKIACTFVKQIIILDNTGQLWKFEKQETKTEQIREQKTSIEFPLKIEHTIKMNKIFAGEDHLLAIAEDSTLWGFGSNKKGQLGIEKQANIKSYSTFIPIPNTNIVQDCTCANKYSLLLNLDGQVFSFGNNDKGQLGVNDTVKRYKPTLIHNIPKIQQIGSGFSFSVLLDETGNVWTCGRNDCNQLGVANDDTNYRDRFEMIENLPEIKQIAVGLGHVLLLDVHEKVWGFGDNRCGEVGVEKPFILSASYLNYIKAPTQLQTKFKVKYITAGASTSMLKDDKGNIWAFGSNCSGQLGIGGFNGKRFPFQNTNFSPDELLL